MDWVGEDPREDTKGQNMSCIDVVEKKDWANTREWPELGGR